MVKNTENIKRRGRPAKPKTQEKSQDSGVKRKRGRPPKVTSPKTKSETSGTKTEEKQKKRGRPKKTTEVKKTVSKKEVTKKPDIKKTRKTETKKCTVKKSNIKESVKNKSVKKEPGKKATIKKNATITIAKSSKKQAEKKIEVVSSPPQTNQHCVINCCSCNRSIYYDTKRTDSHTDKPVERTSKQWGYVFCPHCGTANITRFKDDILGQLE